jgi:hypothetical protein
LPNLERYYSTEKAKAILSSYSRLLKDATPQRCDDLMGRVSLKLIIADSQIMADAQVHLPVRLLASDLIKHNVPVVRYSVEMVAEMMGTGGEYTMLEIKAEIIGIVSHGTDLPIHHLRLSVLNSSEIAAALELHDKLQASIRPTLDPSRGVFLQHNEEEMLVLTRKGDVDWVRDWRWPELRDVKRAVRA